MLVDFDELSLCIVVSQAFTHLHEIRVTGEWLEQSQNRHHLALNCKWFNKSQHSLDLIVGVSTPYYQPSLMDVGSVIYIQIMPSSPELQYVGMPIIRQVGPIRISQQMCQEVKEISDSHTCALWVRIEEFSLNDLVGEALLRIDQKGEGEVLYVLGLRVAQETIISAQIQKEYPQLVLNRSSDRQLSVIFNEGGDYVVIALENNRARDILYMLINMFRDRPPTPIDLQIFNDSAVQDQPTNISQLLQSKLIISELKSKELNLMKERDRLTEALQRCRMEGKMQRERNRVLTEQLEVGRKDNEKARRENEYFEAEAQSSSERIAYYLNENKLLVESNSDLKKQINEWHEAHRRVTVEYTKQKEVCRLESGDLKRTIEQLQKSLEMVRHRNTVLEARQRDMMEEKAVLLEDYNAKREEEEGRYRGVCAKLDLAMQDIAQMSRKLEQSQKQNHQEKAYQKQVAELEQQIRELTIETSYLRAREKSTSKAELKNEAVELKKLVNRLAETITDKDLQIAGLRLVNKQLSSK